MWYNDLRPKKELIPNKYNLTFYEEKLLLSNADKKRTITNLLTLKSGLNNNVPSKKIDNNILIASWNIKEFGHLKERLPESYYYIAEIINSFDLIAIQEIKTSLFDLGKIIKILGDHWSYIITDITEGKNGNRERFGFIYDTRRIKHSGLSGELVVSPEMTDDDEFKQLKRTPSITGFKCGWKKFAVVGVHLHPGNSTNDKIIRKKEIELLLDLYSEKKAKKHLWSENLIILGDTNLYNDNEDIIELLLEQEFIECDGLKGKPTNASLTEAYDRIFLSVDKYFKLKKNNNLESGSVFNLYDYVYTEEMVSYYHNKMLLHKDDPSTLIDDIAFLKYYNRYWKRNQMSDHLPIWIEILEDSSSDFLHDKLL
ncbi:hypothetical protein D1818_11105 [Aquimarina sp. BL5]|uniref:endonuclease/exonuclease/phosphatase family protein n=1 Tax=Aquimarina sp. BL5 TaxID=1714860 RepID=UPI000E500DD6|nr:endonuclease/exonuclease/phosphatase family protein [Aquimarina sp. BL5]AXT51354.1 hypothetical protein D1818_11105 [Aquimarina sp. BL5]RKN09856.1 hypothetical protein D7036_03545 [Aquimarina sp. BL5]